MFSALRRKLLDASRNEIDYAPMETLLGGGLLDAARAWSGFGGGMGWVEGEHGGECRRGMEGDESERNDKREGSASATEVEVEVNGQTETRSRQTKFAVEVEPRTTVPTEVTKDAMHAFAMRLDYILCSASLAKRKGRFQTVVDELTRTSSDHFPVEVEVELE